MKQYTKAILLGLIIWVIPFLASFFVWDTTANAPSVSPSWFYAIMTVTGAIGFAIAAYTYFKNVTTDSVAKAWIAGGIWYAELVLLDLVFLVGLFKMPLVNYYHLPVVYINAFLMTVLIGYLKK